MPEPTRSFARRGSDRLTTGKLVVALLGGLFFLAGGALFLNELREETKHSWHLGFAFGSAVFGAGLLSPDAVFDRLRRMSAVVRAIWKPKLTGESGEHPGDRGVD